MVIPCHGIQCSLTGRIQLTLTHWNVKTVLSAHAIAISAMVNIETCKILVIFTDQNDGIIILFTITDTLWLLLLFVQQENEFKHLYNVWPGNGARWNSNLLTEDKIISSYFHIYVNIAGHYLIQKSKGNYIICYNWNFLPNITICVTGELINSFVQCKARPQCLS